MEAPKEIYILKTKAPDGGLGTSYHLHPIETQKTESIKYIRADKAVDRDALLEEMKFAWGKVSMNPFDANEVFEELISKINEL